MKPVHRSVEILQIRIPLDAVRAVSAAERYTYYLLGHMFNELNFLQKLTGYALPKGADTRDASRHPEIAQAYFLLRIACSKIWEVKLALEFNAVSETLNTHVLPAMEEGPRRLAEVVDAIQSAPWLSAIRNRIGFHFPKFSQWELQTTPDDSWVDDRIFLGKTSGNVFYDASESIAQRWMYELFSPGNQDPEAMVEPLVSKMVELIRIVNDFLEEALGVFISEVLLKGQVDRTSLGKVMAPVFSSISIPFWNSDDAAKADDRTTAS